ncbi:DUF4232 domain-containing protein [Streptomyces sp. NBC_01775]|uniref:DUF4232 domain-containing protein n=1 Tax=Streptomyces sp. NBC_01775 TaxID=2975939 RepID=UPI002DD97BA5|nr:DUF4232 domain-containing protein [Streptomyces sp. NBC_01775]WSB79064.1 DUF4232 domain-containing protein [Streptomyces sp. NBC_01775]
MARHEGMTNGQYERGITEAGTAGAGAGQVRTAPSRFGRPARVAAAAVAVLAASALLTGCGDKDKAASGPQKVGGDAVPAGSSSHNKPQGESEDSDSTSGGSNTTGAGPSKTPASGGSASSGGSAATGGTADGGYGSGAPSTCTADDLKASIGPNHPGAGQENFALVFTNKSGQSCSVRGFPGFAFINSEGEQVSVDPQRDGSGAQTIRLTPGMSASAPLSFSNPQATGAVTVVPAAALLTPPDQRASIRVDWTGGPVSATGKASVPKIGTLSPGAGG